MEPTSILVKAQVPDFFLQQVELQKKRVETARANCVLFDKMYDALYGQEPFVLDVSIRKSDGLRLDAQDVLHVDTALFGPVMALFFELSAAHHRKWIEENSKLERMEQAAGL